MNIFINEYITQNICSAMEEDETDKDYLANVAMAAFNIIKEESFEVTKSNPQSEYYREEGNKAYKAGLFQRALVFYNKALAYAPNISLSLKLAYSNRSAVLFSAKQYQACKKDCDSALAINCPTPEGITEKLEKRRLQAKQNQHLKDFKLDSQKHKAVFQKYADDYFKLKSQHKDIPCASADIDIVFESGIPKVIAKRDIPVGTLVAIEKAFVSWPENESDEYFSCYYCRKLDLNLFPCTGCVVALFCSKQCKEICMKEYHSIECEIISKVIPLHAGKRWMVAAIIKLRNMCSSWEELIALSYKGYNGKGTQKINEIYDNSKPSSLLNFKKDRHFLHGAVFNQSILCAVILSILQNLSYLPQDEEGKQSALKAMARIIMYWGLYCTTTLLGLVTNVIDIDAISDHAAHHIGLFTFIGKLKHSCVPNLEKVTVNNSMALFAAEHIEAGTEMSMTHIFHWMVIDNIHPAIGNLKNIRIRHMYEMFRSTCSCFVCSNSLENLMKDKLTGSQKQAALECFTLQQCRTFGIPPKKCMDQICKILASLSNVKFSAEYKKVHKNLTQFHMYLLFNKLGNTVLSENY